MNKIRLTFQGSEIQIKNKIIRNQTSLLIPYPCEDSTECAPYKISFPPGTFYIELYGASGGNVTKSEYSSTGGKGGKASTVISSRIHSSYYLYIGGHGISNGNSNINIVNGGFNGGGRANQWRGGGGGATDIRTIDSLDHRIIVAAGGGGAYANPKYGFKDGGDGGGLQGEAGPCTSAADDNTPCVGSQDGCVNGKNNYYDEYFGLGSSSKDDITTGGGGGSGFYGGGSIDFCASSGGSSFFDKSKFFIAETEIGVNTGNGFVKITNIVISSLTCEYQNIQVVRLSIIPLIFFLVMESK